ncbi:MAG TPA: hypothetical protein VHM19_14535, partial [Polyangiales bacterium]|nr:hypothetical protein [Polyangiales bacterium]
MKIRFATLAAVALGTVVIAGCIETGQKHDDGVPASPPAAVSCTDHDHDGWGDGCANGHDCNDTDPTVHAGCLHCAVPAEGCACKTGDKPQQCAAPQTQTEDGQIMCNEGTRYCRNGAWSGCEDIYTYPKPDPDSQQSVIDYTGTPIHCSDCAINCYLIHDNLDPIDGGLGNDGDNATINDGGGLSLQTTTPIDVDNYVFDPNTCMLGTAPDRDCDGIQDKYDPYPDQKPFATANPTLFLDVDPGETRSGSIDVSFFLNSADVYFLVDQSGSMAGEAAQLKTDLTTGDFINDSSYDCADYDFDFMPNNELKAQGVIGAVRCLIRDASFGVGLFREIPFSSYAPEDQIVFRNYTDVYSNAYLTMGTPDPKKNIDAAIAGIAQFYTDGNNDWPEADMLALNTLVTGNGMYFGITRPNIPARTTCPAGTWGYPCFRDGAIPIVVMFTDAMMHNGPSSNNYPYSSSALGMTKGTSTTITEIDDHNETFGSAENLTDLTSSYITVQGDTTNMTSDLSYATVTCGSSTSTGGHDALFKFIISGSTNKTVKLTTEGSEFDTTVSLFKGSLASSTTVATGVATNDTNAGAYSLGDNWNKYQRVTGDTSTLAADYSANDLGCGSSPQGKDSVFTFTLSQPTLVALDTANSGFGTVVGIYSGAPKVPSTTTTLPNTNDGFAAAYSVGDLYNNYLAFNGDTSAAGITANQSGGIIGCSTADASPDANYSFTLSQATRVRLSAEESTTFKPVIALTTAGTALPTLTAINNTNDTAATAYDIGDMANKVYQYVGDNSPLAADYPNATTGCNAADSGKDAVFKFTISGSGTKTLNIDTDGSAIDTVLSLYKGTVSSDSIPVVLTSNTNETGSTAQNLGVVDNAKYVVTGGSTAAMTANYTNTQIGCNSTTTTGDAAFKFHVNTARTVRLDTVGTAWDTVLSLHTPSLPDANVTTLLVNNKESLSDPYIIPTAVDSTHQQYNGNTSAMTADVGIDDSAGCSADTSAADAVYKFTVNTAGTYEINTIGSSFNTVLGLFPSNPTYAAPSGPYAKDKSGENKTGSTRPASSASLGDGRTGSTAINMTTTVGGWVVASANITTDATIDPSPQGTDLTTSSVMPMGGTAENAASPQSLGTVVQKLVTVSDSFTSTTN